MITKTIAVLVALAGALLAGDRVPVVIAANATDGEKLAAQELSRYLGKIYAEESFAIESKAPSRGAFIKLGIRHGAPESFAVTHTARSGVVTGADARGLLYGVYAVLEKLGCGFYISYDALPAPRKGAIGFDAWQVADAPLFADRMVFDWHNFLSSASNWELEDWQRYIDQSAKMRFNTIMVHSYGNNPMFQYRYHGETKPVGYLATSARGRDWGTQHVNDVRRLIGGEIFHGPVFGSSIATAPESERADAAMGLMKKVFAYARSRGMHVTFALDVDTESANPQNIIRTLPASARITQGALELANPDTPEGYAYYKAQAQQLLEAYPQIDRLAVWFRGGRTPWRDLTPKQFPPQWREEFKGDPADASIFAIAKVVRAFGKALREIGRTDVELATGSWGLAFVGPADRLMPREATVIPLDYNTAFDTEKEQADVRGLTPGRKLIPIVWAHHDDRTYMGRCYTPYTNFASLLKQSASSGFGIIHWTTRPLDLYFKSTADQVWKQTENQPLRVACQEMAERSFGKSARETGAEYLLKWVTEAPMFGRETRDVFLDHPLEDPEKVIAGCRTRLEMLGRIDGTGDQLDYYRDYERFMLAFYESHSAYERAAALLKRGAADEAKQEIAKCDPDAVIRAYARAAGHGRFTPGEQALLVSMNLRWRPYIVSLRQALGLEPIRVRFGPTQQEPLAQSPGVNTFYVDEQRQMWKTLGEKETGAQVTERGLVISEPFRLKLAPMTNDKLLPGRYTLELLLAPGEASALDLEIDGATKHFETAARVRCPAEVRSGYLEVTVRPAGGKLFLAGAVLAAQ